MSYIGGLKTFDSLKACKHVNSRCVGCKHRTLIVPRQETTITEIKQKIMKLPDASGIVIDGFPRDVAQALSFEDQVSVRLRVE